MRTRAGFGRIAGMNVKDVMTREVRSVRTTDRLDAAARVMWEHDCGLCPVVDASNVLVGVVTDRDLCMASYTQGRALGELPVGAVMARGLRTCKPDDSLVQALGVLQQAQVHRLPVVDARGALVGVLSVSDLARCAQVRPTVLDGAAVLKTIAQIRAPRRAAPAAAAAPAVTAPVAAVTATPAKGATAAVAAPVVAPPASAPAAAKPTTAKAGKPAKKAKGKA